MLELTALAVIAVTQTCRRRDLLPGDAVEVTWRHYSYDPEPVWFLEVEVQTGRMRERLATIAG